MGSNVITKWHIVDNSNNFVFRDDMDLGTCGFGEDVNFGKCGTRGIVESGMCGLGDDVYFGKCGLGWT